MARNERKAPQQEMKGNDFKAASLTSRSSEDGKSSSNDRYNAEEVNPASIKKRAETTTTKSSYRDYSKVPAKRSSSSSSLHTSHAASTKEQTFPVKLHMILFNPAFEDIIGWLPHGRSWRILQLKAFEERVIPLYFRHGRYSSFARQVNGWGFRRITHGSDYNSYYHELFLRGLPHLCDRMRRLTAKDIAERNKEGDEPAPDFYALSRDHALPKSAPVSSTSASLPSATATTTGTASSGCPTPSLADVELAILEKRRIEVIDRINLLSSAQGSRPDSSVLNQAFLLGQQAPASQGPHDLASLQQRFTSSVQSSSGPAAVSIATSTSQFFQQQQQEQQQPNIASLLAALGGNGSQVAPVPAPLPPTPTPFTSSGIGAILQQAGLNALLQQGVNGGGGGVGGQPDLGNLIAQLLQSAGGGGNTQPPSAPAPTPSAHVPTASSFAQLFVGFGGNQVGALQSAGGGGNAHPPSAPAPTASLFTQPSGGFGGKQVSAPAPSAMESSAHVNIAQLLGQKSNDSNSDLQRQLLEARLANTDLSAFWP